MINHKLLDQYLIMWILTHNSEPVNILPFDVKISKSFGITVSDL